MDAPPKKNPLPPELNSLLSDGHLPLQLTKRKFFISQAAYIRARWIQHQTLYQLSSH